MANLIASLILIVALCVISWLFYQTKTALTASLHDAHVDNEKLKKALHVLNVLNFSEEERELYEDHLKWLRIEANTLKKTAEKAREEGIVEGIEKRNIEVAINMLKQKLNDKLISSVTGLSLEEITKLKSRN